MAKANNVRIKYWASRDRWAVQYQQDGKEATTICRTKKAAEAEAARLQAEIRTAGAVWAAIPADERDQIIKAYLDAKEKGIDLSAALGQARVEQAAAAEAKPVHTLAAVKQETLDDRKTAECSTEFLGQLRCVLGQFIRGREELPIDKIVVGDLRNWLKDRCYGSKKAHRSCLSAMFGYAARMKYIETNLVASLGRMAKRGPKSVRILSLEQFSKCLAWFAESHKWSDHSPAIDYSYAFGWFVLTSACGLRPVEATRVRKSHIDFNEGCIDLDAALSKVRERRLVYPPAPAMALLKKAVDGGARLPLGKQPKARMLRRLRTALDWERWDADITRHTCASNWLALAGDAGEVALHLGNSEYILLRDYRRKVTRTEAARFWDYIAAVAASWPVVPKVPAPAAPVAETNVVPLPAQALAA